MSDNSDETASRRRRGSATTASPSGAPLTSGDILWEIFLRLPPLPSSLLRISLVCKRWHLLVADPDFLLRFCAYHRKAPLLGLFKEHGGWVSFNPTLDPPNCISGQRFTIGIPFHGRLLGCRHGHVLILDPRQRELIVCDPITGELQHIALPREFTMANRTEGAVLCSNSDKGHVHGGCHSSPFKVVLVGSLYGRYGAQVSACVYFSETGTWSNLISIAKQRGKYIDSNCPSTLVGNCLYWWIYDSPGNIEILEFDIGRQSLSMIDSPPILKFVIKPRQIVQGENGGVGFSILSYPIIRIYDWKVDCAGEVSTWVLRKTVNLDLVAPNMIARKIDIVGYVEDDDAILIKFNNNVFSVHLKSTQSNKLCESMETHRYYPFTSFYSSGNSSFITLL